MGRPPRTSLGGYVYHVTCRGKQAKGIFRSDADYEDFERALIEAQTRFEVRLLSYCCLPNRWHLVFVPRQDGDLSSFMAWLVMTHSSRWHTKPKRSSSGGLYEPRYKSFPVQDNQSLLEVMHFVESLPIRESSICKNAAMAHTWPWRSTKWRLSQADWLAMPPIAVPEQWLESLAKPIPVETLAKLENSLKRGTPYGSPAWTLRVAGLMHLESTLRPRGRPPQTK